MSEQQQTEVSKKILPHLEEVLKDEGLEEDWIESIDPSELAKNNPEYLEEARQRFEKEKKEALEAAQQGGERLLDLEHRVSELETDLDDQAEQVSLSQLSSLQKRVSDLEDEFQDLKELLSYNQTREEIEKKYGLKFPEWITEDRTDLPTFQALGALIKVINPKKGSVKSALEKLRNWKHKEEDVDQKQDYFDAREKLKDALTRMNTWQNAAREYYKSLTKKEPPAEVPRHFFAKVIDFEKEGRPPLGDWRNEKLIESIEPFLGYKEDIEDLKEVMRR